MPPKLKRAIRIFLNIIIGVFFIYGLAVASGAVIGLLIAKNEDGLRVEQQPQPNLVAPPVTQMTDHPVDALPKPQLSTPAPVETHPANPAMAARSDNEPESFAAPKSGWRKNAILIPAYAYRDKKLVAVIIDDAGMSVKRTRELIDIPVPLVMSFLPYAPRVDAQVKAARAAGHEVMVHLPMEPLDVDAHPGPDALMLDMEDAEIGENLNKNLDRFDSYIGVNNHMGSKFTSDTKRMRLVLQELKKRDLIFVDSMTSPQSIAGKMANQMGILSGRRDVFLDDVDDPEKIKQQFQKLSEVAQRHGAAIAIGHPRPNTIAALKDWLASIEGGEVMVVPLSVVLLEQQKSKNKNHD